jgi:tetratricopeptide (TPR) repeat protein
MHFLAMWCLSALLLNPMPFDTPLSGQIEMAGTHDYSRLRVQLLEFGGRSALREAPISAFGAFEIQAAPSGLLLLQIVNLQNEPIHTQSVTLPFQGVLVVKLPLAGNTPARMPISLARLRHNIPRKALHAYRNGRLAIAKNDIQLAKGHYEAAVRLDPQYFEAANDLGVIYLSEGRLSEAYEMFLRATTIDQGDPKAEANLAYALLAMHRFPEAEAAARSSVRADATSSQGRYLLAVSLLEQKKSSKEVMFHLGKAKDGFEPARKLYERLLASGPASLLR